MNVSKFYKSWTKANKLYEKMAYRIFRNAFIEMTKGLPFNVMTVDNYKTLIDNTVQDGCLERAYVEVYRDVGLLHGNLIGKGINKEIKNFNPFLFESDFVSGLADWVLNNVGYRITSTKETYIEFIQKIIEDAIKEEKTIVEIAREIQKLVGRRDFYRWQALRIARTETTAAANRGATIAGSSSGVLLEKQWISATDLRTRRKPPSKYDHVEMNLKKVGEKEFFNVNGEKIEYPGAPTTQSGAQSSGQNVINCRCAVALVPKRDENGRVIRI